MYNSVLSIRITSVYGSQPSSVVFACKTSTFGPELQVSMGTRPHLSFSACKTSWLASELPVSMDPRPHLSILIAKQRLLVWNYKSLWIPALTCGFWMHKSDFWTRTTSLYGSQTSAVVLCMQNIVISTRIKRLSPSPRVWFLDAKQRILDRNNRSLCVPDMTCRFVHVQQRA